MKNIGRVALTLVMAGVLVLPNVSSAQTVESLQAQIAALLAQIQQLQTQLTQVQSGGGGTQKWCHNFNTNLGIGSSGSEVQALNYALANAGAIDEKSVAKDDFDEIVASAVTSFQEKYRDDILDPSGLKNGTGYVGKSTRKKLNQLYGCVSIPNPIPPSSASMKFSASPTSGPAPLIVWFSAALPDGTTNTRSYSVDFGDGSRGEMWWVNGKGADNSWGLTASHTYAAAGTYTAKLTRTVYNDCKATSNTSCAAWYSREETAGTATITVASSGTTTLAPRITVRSVSGTNVDFVYSGMTAGWNVWLIGVSSTAQALPLTATMPLLPGVPVSYTTEPVWSWSIPYNGAGDNTASIGTSPAGNYVFEVSNLAAGGWVTKLRTQAFAVGNSTASTPTITITSPNGGENIVKGQPFQITWQASSDLSDTLISAYIDVQGGFCKIGSANGLGGIMEATLQDTGDCFIAPGSYRILLYANGGPSGGSIAKDQSDNYFTVVAPATTSAPIISSVSIIDGMSSYTAGQTIKFSVKAVTTDDGKAAEPGRGFNVQSSMRMLDPTFSYLPVTVNGTAQSFNATYNQSTGYWDVTMTAPSDSTKTYDIDTAAYCANASLGCSSGQINKYFQFTIPASATSTAAPTITITSPLAGDVYTIDDINFKSAWKRTDPNVGIGWVDFNLVNVDTGVKTSYSSSDTSASLGGGSSGALKNVNPNLSGRYKIVAILKSSDAQVAESGIFQITASSATSTSVPFGTISVSPNSCTIANGTNGCSVSLTWNTSNVANPNVSADVGFTNTISLLPSSFGYSYRVTKGTTTFNLKDGYVLLSSVRVTASCASGSDIGSDGNCNPVPTVTVTANPASVGWGETSYVSWTSSNTTSCKTSSSPGDPGFALAGTGTSGGASSYPLYGPTTFTVTCSGSGGNSSASSTVLVANTQGMQQVPDSTGQTANMLQAMTAILQNMLKSVQ